MNIAMTVFEHPLRYYFQKWKAINHSVCYGSDSDTNSDCLLYTSPSPRDS